MHSTYHQNPKHYAGKTVVVLGAGLSGSDVSMDIHYAAKHVMLKWARRVSRSSVNATWFCYIRSQVLFII